jgi:hypothetical protein
MATHADIGSPYDNHQRAAELQDEAAHTHQVAEQNGQQDHLSGHEHSRQSLEHAPEAHQTLHDATVGHGIAAFTHNHIATRARELWMGRGCPEGSAQDDWYHAVEELRSQAFGH